MCYKKETAQKYKKNEKAKRQFVGLKEKGREKAKKWKEMERKIWRIVGRLAPGENNSTLCVGLNYKVVFLF